MRPAELVGYLASALVFATFTMQAMLPLRLIAIASNVMFLAYGHLADAMPIVLLHAGLLPLNALRLCQTLRAQDDMADGADRAGQGAGPSMRFLRRKRLPRPRPGVPGHGTMGGPGRLPARAPCVADACGGPLV
jgi:CRP/FNR family transcriptional regulator, cyclic AMP receptor protein